MPRTRTPYPTEFREHIVALARAGRSVESLAREFEPCAATIHLWLKQAQQDTGERDDGVTSAEREELRRLRRENKVLRQERDILSKGRHFCAIGPRDNGDAWFAQGEIPSSRSSGS